MPDLLTIDDIAARFGVSRRTVADQWVHRPGFPPPMFAPTPKHRRWLAAEVDAWAMPSERRSAARPVEAANAR